MHSPEWPIEFLELKKLLDQLNAYVEANDWTNAHLISQVLQFKIKFYPLYEEERLKVMNCRKENTK